MTLKHFLAAIKTSRILSDRKYQAVKNDAAARSDYSATKFANRLVKKGVLTKWQAKTLLAGETGLRVGQYHLRDVVGRGGMGVVFKAWDSTHKRIVAIKVMAKKYWKNEALVSRFRREIQAATLIDSPHVVRAFDAGHAGSVPYLVMEFVDGEDVETLVKRIDRMTVPAACEIIRQAAVGLQQAHKNGIVHRDIKPSNLIISWTKTPQPESADAPADANAAPDQLTDPVIKIFDMGLVRMTQNIANDGATRPGQVMGTPDYMSPEQGYNTASVDSRADIYSLGCSLWRLIVGEVPFKGDNPLQTLVARCSTDPPLVSKHVATVPPAVDSIVYKMMERDPDARFQTPLEVAAALEPFAKLTSPDELAAEKLATTDSQSIEVDDSEVEDLTFRKFLQDIERGAQHDSEESFEVKTESDESVVTPVRRAGRSNRARRKRSQWPIAVAMGAIAALVLGGLGYVLTANERASAKNVVQTDPATDQSKQDDPPEDVVEPEFPPVLMAPAQKTYQPGDKIVFDIRHPEFFNDGGTIEYKFAKSPPENCTLNHETGIFEWQTDASTAPSYYQFTFVAHANDDSRPDVPLTVDVQIGKAVSIEIPAQLAKVDTEFRLKLAQFVSERIRQRLENDGQRAPEFSITSPTGAVDAEIQKGSFVWTPRAQDVGKQRFLIEGRRRSDRVLLTAELNVTVSKNMASAPSVAIARIPRQSVRVGEVLTARILVRNNAETRQENTIQIVNPLDGMRINPSGYMFVWTPDANQTGTHEVELQLVSRADPETSLGKRSFEIDVLPKKAAESTRAPVPSATDIASSKESIDKLYRREFTAARSVSARRELSHKLLERARESDSRSVTQFVLFDMARELAVKARDFLTTASCIQETEQLFEIDVPQVAAKSLSGLRSKDVDPVAGDVLPEYILPFIRDAVANSDDDAVRRLSNTLRLVGTARQNAMLKQYAESIPKLHRASLNKTDADAAAIAKTELDSILKAADFVPIFTDLQRIGFFRHSTGDLDDLGRSLWSLENSEVILDATDQTSRTGFADRSQSATSFSFRCWVSSATNTGDIMFGVPVQGTLTGYQLHIGNNDFCTLRTTGENMEAVRPRRQPARSTDGWDAVELIVRSDMVVVKLNGLSIIEQPILTPATGSIGIDANLGLANPAVVRLRGVRIRIADPSN